MAAVMGFLGWFLLGWAVVSAIATPFVARLVASRLGDPPEQECRTPELGHAAHD